MTWLQKAHVECILTGNKVIPNISNKNTKVHIHNTDINNKQNLNQTMQLFKTSIYCVTKNWKRLWAWVTLKNPEPATGSGVYFAHHYQKSTDITSKCSIRHYKNTCFHNYIYVHELSHKNCKTQYSGLYFPVWNFVHSHLYILRICRQTAL